MGLFCGGLFCGGFTALNQKLPKFRRRRVAQCPFTERYMKRMPKHKDKASPHFGFRALGAHTQNTCPSVGSMQHCHSSRDGASYGKAAAASVRPCLPSCRAAAVSGDLRLKIGSDAGPPVVAWLLRSHGFGTTAVGLASMRYWPPVRSKEDSTRGPVVMSATTRGTPAVTA